MSETDGNTAASPSFQEDAAKTPIDAACSALATKLNTSMGGQTLVMCGESLYADIQGQIFQYALDGTKQKPLAQVPGQIWTMTVDDGSRSGGTATLYAVAADRVWRVPLAGADAGTARAVATLNGGFGIAVSPDGTYAAVTTANGLLFRVDLQTGYHGEPIATQLGAAYAVAFDLEDDPTFVYVAQHGTSSGSSNVLWRVPLDGNGDKTAVAQGFGYMYGLKVMPHQGPGGSVTSVVYVSSQAGDLWRVPLGGSSTVTVSRDQHLAVYNLGDGRAPVQFDAQGVAYAVAGRLLWRIEQVEDPAAPPKPKVGMPVIRTPRDGGVTGPRPDFSGTVLPPVPAGTTIHATDGTTVIADGVPVDPVTTHWLFDRLPWAEGWPAGQHTVTVTARCDGATSDPATVTFTVDPGSFDVTPGGPPGVHLVRGGAPGYPGVHLHNGGQGAVAPQDVTVVLPAGKRLRFESEAGTDYQLSVMDSQFNVSNHIGALSVDGQSLVFRQVDLALPVAGAVSAAWVSVTAANDAPVGPTALAFTVARKQSVSTSIVVKGGGFSLSPGGPPDVHLERGGETGYPGVHLRNEGEGPVDPQDIAVSLPVGKNLNFVPEKGVQYLLTVMDANGTLTQHIGLASADGHSLSFPQIDLALPGKGSTSVAWISVAAAPDAPVGDTALDFSVGGEGSASTPIKVG